ncbi:hypothetical protein HAALTHF_26160n [Vreelandella aquamarina]|nr:hypothetical protein HAALTHF_26160n [Halomonas axialensis]
MKRKPIVWIVTSWFVLVNAGQFYPPLNTIEPYVLGVPFNLAWIWGFNGLITLYLVYCAIYGFKSHDIDEKAAYNFAKDQGVRGYHE